ncbi:Glycosyl transferase family 64 domain containing protein [Naviculisporaceae sp. PSN 640]
MTFSEHDCEGTGSCNVSYFGPILTSRAMRRRRYRYLFFSSPASQLEVKCPSFTCHITHVTMASGIPSRRREVSRRAKIWCMLVLVIIISSFFYKNPTFLVPGRIETTKKAKQPQCKSNQLHAKDPTAPSGYAPSCGGAPHAEARKFWLEAVEAYSCLRDDKFTVVMPTYKRPLTLETTLAALLGPEIPSLHEIVVIWNDVNSTPPHDFTSPRGIPVRYHVPEKNSLNNRFIPLPAYETQAILSTDDDIWFKAADLEFTFQVWRQLGRYRIMGTLSWCHRRIPEEDYRLVYTRCPEGADGYSLVSTGLAFVHISFLHVYSSSLTIPARMRAHVDRMFNCEDIAMNFLVSMLTCSGPLHVLGQEALYRNTVAEGLSSSPDHMDERDRCMTEFKQIMGFIPLVEQ